MDLNNLEILPEIRIMPLGDSITQANTEYDSYRRPLWQRLQASGYNTVDFVGSLSENFDEDSRQNGPHPNPDFDLDHEGHWGFRTDEILVQLDSWVTTAQPDVALIHLGTNDILQGQSAESTIEELEQVIDVFRANNPKIAILLAQIIPTKRNDEERQAFNEQIPILAAEKNQANSPILVIDQNSGFDFTIGGDTYDIVHPNSSGENKFADQWLGGLEQLFSSEQFIIDIPVAAEEETPVISEELDPDVVEEDVRGTEIERYYDPLSGIHVQITESTAENLNNSETDYVFEGTSYVGVNPLVGGQEVFALRNIQTGGYLHTMSSAERDFILNQLNNFESVESQFSAFDRNVEGTIAVHRFFEPTSGDFLFTSDSQEISFIQENLNYNYEGVAFYAYEA